jgi:hypothetical protein
LLLETNGDLAVYEGEYPNKVNLLWTGTRTAAGCGTPTMFRWRYYFTIKIGGKWSAPKKMLRAELPMKLTSNSGGDIIRMS